MGYRRRRKTITLKFAGKCADCGAVLAVGTTARWYGRGRVYGLDCHEDSRVRQGREIRGTVGDPVPAGRQREQHADDFPPTNVQLAPTEKGSIPQTKLFD